MTERRVHKALLAAVVFVLCFAVHAFHHFYLLPDKITFLYDGKHYLETCEYLTRLITACCADWSGASSIANDSDFRKHLLFDGPIAPIVPAVAFSLMHRVPSTEDWQVIILLNSLCHAASAVLLLFLAIEATNSLRWGLLAAILFVLCPSIVVTSGRYLTEPWAMLFLLAFVYMWTRSLPSSPSSSSSSSSSGSSKVAVLLNAASRFVAGFFAGLLAVTKTALVPGVILALVVVERCRSRNIKQSVLCLLTVVAGVAVATAPWFLFTANAAGAGTIFNLRQPVYNAAVGVDLDTDAWCTIPDSPFVASMVLSNSAPLRIQAKAVTENGGALAGLAVRKIGRLVSHPWNDARQPVFNIVTPEAQEVFHRVLFCLSLCGIALWLTRDRQRSHTNDSDNLVLTCSLCVIAGHLSYVCFQSMGRYFYATLPFLFIFCVFGLKTAYEFVTLRLVNFEGLPRKQVVTAPVALIAAVSCTVLLCLCDHWGEPYGGFAEDVHILPEQSLDFDISRTKEVPSKSAVLLLVDSDENIEQAVVQLNGRPLANSLRPAGRFSSTWYQALAVLREHAGFLRRTPSSLRQWRAILLPVDQLNLQASNKVSLINHTKQPMRIYGDCRERSYLLSPSMVSSDKMLVSMDNADLRLPQPLRSQDNPLGLSVKVPRVQSDKTNPAVVLVLATQYPFPDQEKAVEETAAFVSSQSKFPREFSSVIELSTFPNWAVSGAEQTIRVKPQSTPKADPISGWVKIPEMHFGSQYTITLTGKAKLLAGDGRIGIRPVIEKSGGLPLIPSTCPDFIDIDTTWKTFTIEDCVPVTVLGGGIKSVVVELYHCPISQKIYGYGVRSSDALIKDLRVHIRAEESFDASSSGLRFN